MYSKKISDLSQRFKQKPSDWYISLQDLLPRDNSPNHQPSDRPGYRGRPRATGCPIDSSGAEPCNDAVDPVVFTPKGDHSALHPGVEKPDHADPVANPTAVLARGVEDAIDTNLEGIPGLGGAGGAAEADSSSRDGAAEIADSSVVGEVLTPGAALGERLLLEEELRRGREVV